MLRPKSSIYPAVKKLYPEETLPLILFFSAAWCGKCQEQKPIMAELEAEFSGKIKVIVVDTDADEPDLVTAAGIKAIPTLVGISADRSKGSLLVGQKSKDELRKLFEAAQSL